MTYIGLPQTGDGLAGVVGGAEGADEVLRVAGGRQAVRRHLEPLEGAASLRGLHRHCPPHRHTHTHTYSMQDVAVVMSVTSLGLSRR